MVRAMASRVPSFAPGRKADAQQQPVDENIDADGHQQAPGQGGRAG